MNTRQSRLLFWGIIGAVLILTILYSFWPRAVVSDIGTLSRFDIRVTVSEEAKTRVHDIYVLSAPVTGYIRRIESEVGDPVVLSETVVAKIEPIDPAFLDPRTEAQARADIEAANSSTKLAKETVNQAEAELEFALSELNRMRELRRSNSVSERDIDNAQRAYKTNRAALGTAQANLQMRLFELERAKAQLLSPAVTIAKHGDCQCVDILAPITGRILKVLNKSEGVVSAGTPLVEIGDPQDLEIVVELLSFDAVKVQPGQDVIITNWGGERDLMGVVKHVEPIGFKKVSALGIEEQRVNVLVDFRNDKAQWSRLGHGYQLDVDIVLSESNDVLAIPITALFREQQKWAVYAVVENRVEKRFVELGVQNHLHAQITKGLREGEGYILHPNDQIQEGVKVVQQQVE